ncbi:MAG: glutamate--tRNA ligase [Gammaproteobacteria bacterium]|nr:glutamate--tRNA ligase [Gammaproteobacteria bacterium]
MTVRTRFAPSPTGHLHVGNARTALFSALLAVRDGGEFILRIEDTDADRSRQEFETALMEDLAWLGIGWQEGPDKGGTRGPYRQSERMHIYEEFIDKLAAHGSVYPCFCTPVELDLSRKLQLAAGKPPRYSGTCAHLSTAEIEARLAKGLKPALRFRVPETGETAFDDLVRGRQAFAHQDIGDFIIRRGDGSPAFFFSNAVDDALMGITHVLRGEDHLANTPRQVLILETLRMSVPHYGHLSLIVGADGAPLSKRHGSTSVRDLMDRDCMPGAVLNYLARLGHTYPDADNRLLSFEELAAEFDIAKIGRSPAHFDDNHLHHWQKIAIAGASDAELWEWMKHGTSGGHSGTVESLVPSAKRSLFVQTVRPNVLTASEIISDDSQRWDTWSWAVTLFGNEDIMMDAGRQAISKAGPDYFQQALACLPESPEFRAFVQTLASRANVRGPGLYMPLRAALTGDIHGPELKLVWELLGMKLISERLKAAMGMAKY